MPKVTRLLASAVIMGIAASPMAAMPEQEETAVNKPAGKKVLMIVASQDFRDEEFSEPHRIITAGGAKVTVASSRTGSIQGMLGRRITAERLVKELSATDYDCIIFVGGIGAQEYFNDAAALRIARDAAAQGKLLAAICIAPATLANGGVLNGRKATCFPSVGPLLTKGGAILEKKKVVRDGKVITAMGPEAAVEFGNTIAAALQE